MARTLKMLASVPIVMACALAGTAGLLKAIGKRVPGVVPPKGGRA